MRRYDATRSLGHVRFDAAPATEVEADPAPAWHLAQALIAAEAGAMVRVAADDEVPTVAAAPGVAEDFLAALECLGGPVSS